MSGICLLAGALTLHLTSPEFQLSWQHSVEKTGWRENWRVERGLLRLEEAAVKGSGAGMDPGPDARLEGTWWVWTPDLAPVEELLLAASGATNGGWRLCAQDNCHDLGTEAGAPIRIAVCPAEEAKRP
ncbi:MAG: DUF1850 domain-containing protein [Rhodobacteraceae bacterium]|nr:DUF1850 domain-containing protein [Paracoccaceae bacterium]